MNSYNRVEICGHLGEDVNLRYSGAGVASADLSVASNHRWRDNTGEWHEETEWTRVALFRRLAEQAEGWRKGMAVHVIGRMRTERWTDRDGVVRYTTKVVASNVMALLPTRRESAEKGADTDVPF